MSYQEYILGREISTKGYPFYALIQAAMRQADTDNLEKLKSLFPETFREFQTRYNSPKGLLLDEIVEEENEEIEVDYEVVKYKNRKMNKKEYIRELENIKNKKVL